MFVMRGVVHLLSAQLIEPPAKQFFRGWIHRSDEAVLVHREKAFAHVRDNRFVEFNRPTQRFLRELLLLFPFVYKQRRRPNQCHKKCDQDCGKHSRAKWGFIKPRAFAQHSQPPNQYRDDNC